MVPSIVNSTLEMIDKWNKSLASKESGEVDIWPDLEALTYEVMCKTLAVGETSEDIRRIHQLRLKVNEQAAKVAKLMFFPGWW